ncbi:MAG TPA: CapA family protein [candidate division Zixibacteria bacterium]|nr:CapA family protein [candidate division Zixibacteria bacterium]
MHQRTRSRIALVVAVAAVLAGCGTLDPTPVPSPRTTPSPVPSPTPTASPSPTPVAPVEFPLAVVTGLTNLKPAITLEELAQLASGGQLVLPCAVEVLEPALSGPAECVAADEIASVLEAEQQRIALLPPGLVEPATKVLRIAGDAPFGLFGPDLFGDPEARALDYPVIGSAMPDDPAVQPAWIEHDPDEIWTLTNLGSLCADRGAAYEAVTLGEGWDWAFGGGTATYAAPAEVDPPDPPPFGAQRPVRPVDGGNDGLTASIVRRSDVAIADHECPVVRDEVWAPQLTTTNVFSVPEALIPFWKDTLGLDVLYLAANHMSDKGVPGIQSTIELLDEYGLPFTGLGMNLDEALEPAYVEVAGLKVGVVAFNEVPGVVAADADTPGVPWITQENITEGVRRAREGGADLVICAPQWWGGAEYHDDLWPTTVTHIGWMDEAGCDQVIGSGTHVAGPLIVEGPADDPRLVLVSPGNYMFGQGWWQETQEGVILDLTFRGTRLVNVRLHPTVQIRQARPALLDPQGDGHYVLERIWKYAQVEFTR